MNPFLGIWLVVNAVCVYFIATISVLAVESNYLNILFFPLLVQALREDFTKLGTALVTIFITLCFLPAIILYLAAVILCCIVYMLGCLVIKPFKRKD